MDAVNRHAPVRFLRTVFDPEDWVAIFLKLYVSSGVAQRVGPVSVGSDRTVSTLAAGDERPERSTSSSA